jgi:hypothetical protein
MTVAHMVNEALAALEWFKAHGRQAGEANALKKMFKDRRLYWHMVASDPDTLEMFNKAIREFQDADDTPPVDDPPALERWAQGWARRALSHVVRA